MTQLENLIAYLKQITEFYQEPMVPIERFIFKHGINFTAAKRPNGLRKQRDKECYANASRLCMRDPTLSYVEGIAVHDGIIPIHHAWCAKDGVVVDPTWRWPERSAYRGIIVPTDTMMKTIYRNGVYGVLCDGVRINVELMKSLAK